MTIVYKIASAQAWHAAGQFFNGAAIDLADGYIHLSGADQVEETAARHFARQTDLVLVAFDATDLGDALRWEISRGGALFPHLYGPLPKALAKWCKALPWRDDAHEFPEGWRE